MDKDELRLELRDEPKPSAHQSKVVADHLFGFLSSRLPGTITTYRAMDDEVNVSGLVDRLPGWRWLLPRIEDDGLLTWRDARVRLETHRWGMEQPAELGPAVQNLQIDIFLVPGLAFDVAGNRLGRGSGYYDRELTERRPDSSTVGVTVESRILASIPVEPHDQPVSHLASEVGVIGTTPTR